jgi:hypothetical protein
MKIINKKDPAWTGVFFVLKGNYIGWRCSNESEGGTLVRNGLIFALPSSIVKGVKPLTIRMFMLKYCKTR